MKKYAVVLMNLGGPDKISSVKEFLFNLFYDEAIIPLPKPFRWLVAKIISNFREEKAKKIYERIGGKSPIVEETQKQALALKQKLANNLQINIYIAMRYWYPFTEDVLKELLNYNPDEVILLPLYPQFSTTTTGSSIKKFLELAKKYSLKSEVKTICCYPVHSSFLQGHVQLIKNKLDTEKNIDQCVIIFSAHGLPCSVIKKGDPYQWQVEKTFIELKKALSLKDVDYVLSYQSKVGAGKWLEPSTDKEIIKYSKQNKIIIVVPIAFVSEHSETLVELDMDYKDLALENGAKKYIRIPSLSTNDYFIDCLSDLVNCSLKNDSLNFFNKDTSYMGCPKEFCKCFIKEGNGE